jgi:hypothetical protein
MIALGVLACTVSLGIVIDKSGVDSAKDFNISLERRKAWCGKMRSSLELAKHLLWSKRSDDREVGSAMLTEGAMDFQVTSCAAESYLSLACDVGDRACMINSIDWALVNIR